MELLLLVDDTRYRNDFTHIRRVSGLEHAYVVVCGIREEDGHANLPWSIWNWLRDKA